ncbi:serine hydrolase [Adlercreutzia agrestimuris]|uniref:serine hydrolase n=1 Tax=Adlercreutzia agrestimuris TaxID=2941324 RepID=UPI00203BB734|nr:serine hydrolase [Adlercreutzia agrestimuris]
MGSQTSFIVKHNTCWIMRRLGSAFLAIVLGMSVAIAMSSCSFLGNQEEDEPLAEQTTSSEETQAPEDTVNADEKNLISAADREKPDKPQQKMDAPNKIDFDSLESKLNEIIAPYGGSVSVAFVDLESGEAFSVRGGVSQPAASMIKLVVLAELFDQAEQNALSMDDVLTMKASDVVGGTGVIQYDDPNTEYTLGELAYCMISESDNTAANMLIELLGMSAINDEAQKLGLTSSELRRLMMDQEAISAGIQNMMSADDIASIFAQIQEGKFYSPELSDMALEFLEMQADNSGLQAGLPSSKVFAHKTGTLTNMQIDGGIVEGDHPYVLVVMADGIDNDRALSLMREVAQAVDEQVESA